MANLYTGTSGFAYPSWKPDFYPDKLPSKKFLGYYSGRLNAVEVNYTFRRLPSASTLENWVNETRAGLRISAQGPHADHAHSALEAIRVHRGVLQGHRSAADSPASGPGTVSAPAGHEVRRSLAGRFLEYASTGTYATPSSSATSPGWWIRCTGCSRNTASRCAWPNPRS